MLNVTNNPITLSVIMLNAVMLSVTDNLTHSLTMLDVKKCGPMSLKADIYLTRANGPSGSRAFTYNNAG
jgi:hypothetical protein